MKRGEHTIRRGSVPNEERLRALGEKMSAPTDAAPTSAGAASSATGVPASSTVGALASGAQTSGTQRPPPRTRHVKHVRSRRRKIVMRGLLVLGIAFVVLVAAVAAYLWHLNDEIHRVVVKGLRPSPAVGPDMATENILMVGSTSRCALAVQNPAYGLCSQGVNGVNSDVVMILHLNPDGNRVSILSIPRDVFVPNARAEGANKIDAALYEGPNQLVDVIEEDFGIPIQHYVELNFDSFANVVQALGGIKMYFPEPVFDANSGLYIPTAGCHVLNGVQALEVVRSRELQYEPPGVPPFPRYAWPKDPQSDLARIRRDHEFLRVLAEAVAKRGLGNPFTDQQIVAAVAPQLEVDSGFSATHMVGLVLTYHSVNIRGVPQLTTPVLVVFGQGQDGSYIYQGGTYGDVEFPSEPQDRNVIDQFLGVNSDIDTMNGGHLPSPSAVTVSVLNGTGAYNQAATTASSLGALGFRVVGVGDSTSVGAQSETVVTYASRTPQLEAAAQAVVHSLSGAVVMALGPTTDGAQVTVTTGSDFTVNPPPAPAPSTTAGTGTAPATSPTTTAPAQGPFGAPTASVESLEPWDPRSCTASGGEGP